MLEVFTVGGGEYLVNTFNAVAAWSGGGGYKSLIRVVMVMGLIYSLITVAFSPVTYTKNRAHEKQNENWDYPGRL